MSIITYINFKVKEVYFFASYLHSEVNGIVLMIEMVEGSLTKLAGNWLEARHIVYVSMPIDDLLEAWVVWTKNFILKLSHENFSYQRAEGSFIIQ